MENSAATDILKIGEILCDTNVEQPIEGDFTIPDYQPEIFKIVKAICTPVIVQKIAVGTRATVDGYAKVTVIYQTDGEQRLYAITQRIAFSRQAELKKAVGDNATMLCDVAVSYLNCRAINQRRIDIRGAANISIKLMSSSSAQFISAVVGDGAQQHETQVEYIGQFAHEEKQFTLEEPLEIKTEAEGLPVVLRCDAKVLTEEIAISENRVVVSGSAIVWLALDMSENGEIAVKRFSYSIPFSQVVDIDGVAMDSAIFAEGSVISCTASTETAEDGTVDVSVSCVLEVTACESKTANLITDVFSTKYAAETVRENVSVVSQFSRINQNASVRETVDKPAAQHLTDWFISSSSVSLSGTDPCIAKVSAVVCYLLKSDENDVTSYEHALEFETPIEDYAPNGTLFGMPECVFRTLECTESETALSFKAEGTIYGVIDEIKKTDVLKEAKIDTTRPKVAMPMALTIYYADKGEKIWDIAKRFNTSAQEIMLENELIGSALEQDTVLLIPII
ncbi:MAG: DUF3794 domain-containing protein [Oscillospiraceae bacterium]